jgi:CheY-like chemotaxis protein
LSNFGQNVENPDCIPDRMASNNTLLCIHRDPAELSLLQDNGYELVTAANGSEALRLFMARPVDAIVLEHHLGLLHGADFADVIKQVRPEVPIVLLTEDLELPDGALKSVDAIVTKADGVHFLWATVHFVLNARPAAPPGTSGTFPTNAFLRFAGRSWKGKVRRNIITRDRNDEKADPFTPSEWRGIRNGNLRF